MDSDLEEWRLNPTSFINFLFGSPPMGSLKTPLTNLKVSAPVGSREDTDAEKFEIFVLFHLFWSIYICHPSSILPGKANN